MHDVSHALREKKNLLPKILQENLKEITAISRSLRKDRELVFYGTEDWIPTAEYSEQDSIEAIQKAEKIFIHGFPYPQKESGETANQGFPSYTFQKAPGELWRSRYQAEQNVIVINNAHRDFVYASRSKALKLRYICRLFAKELVYKNFPGLSPDQLLERMIELSLYSEENLK